MKAVQQLENAVLGLTGEAGEIADHFKKHKFHGHELDTNHIKKELGDIMWYVSQACDALGCTIDEVAQMNISKLQLRYPEGFSAERSINRRA